jgi:signal transduction histidine kinase
MSASRAFSDTRQSSFWPASGFGPSAPPYGWRTLGSRLRVLVLLALAGCIGLAWLAWSLTTLPALGLGWQADASGALIVAEVRNPLATELLGQRVLALEGPDSSRVALDAGLMQRSPRWMVHADQRDRQAGAQRLLHHVLEQGRVALLREDGPPVPVDVGQRGWQGLGLTFWALALLALGLGLMAAMVLLIRPTPANLAYAAIAAGQVLTLLAMACTSVGDLLVAPWWFHHDLTLRATGDLLTVTGVIAAVTRHPRRLPAARAITAAAALVALGSGAGLAATGWGPVTWPWLQAVTSLGGLVALGLLWWSGRREPHPLTRAMCRFGSVALAAWWLLGAAIAIGADAPTGAALATIGPVAWTVFMVSLLLLQPFLSRSRAVLREFALIAAVSTLATSADLLFIALFSWGHVASLTLSVLLALVLYGGVRRWMMQQLLAGHVLSVEDLFEHLYRVAREVERQPARLNEALEGLLARLFDPLEMRPVPRRASVSWVVADGSTLFVPLPDAVVHGQAVPGHEALALRFAQRGRRLFTAEDARLCDRMIDQLRRAVAYDLAVEQGRHEERTRLAQDLHDDIGARLLTLIYQARDPRTEEYVRHTLQDLKTLTRGLAAQEHRLSHAAAEWKRDVAHRLEAAHCQLAWQQQLDADPRLSVMQWSALTRVLRELVSNTLAHAKARRVQVSLGWRDGELLLTVQDDGQASDPTTWSPGLGLGGVRKRVRQLGGKVQWRALGEPPAGPGIRCDVRVPLALD